MEIMAIPITDIYYLINRYWVYFNIAMIPGCFIPFIVRLRDPDFKKRYWTDYLTRGFLLFIVLFYQI